MIKNYYLVVAFLCTFMLNAQQAGDLDTSFGTNGIVKTNLWNAAFNVKSHVVLPDGKTIVVGEINNDVNPRGFILRLLTNGELDVTFGTDGKSVHPFLTGFNVVKLQADGKLVVGSSYNFDFAVARYLANGSLDTGFAFDGTYYNTNPDENPFIAHPVIDLEIQADNKIVGLTTTNDSGDGFYRLFRLNANGILDNTLTTIDSFSTNDLPVALSVQSDGKLVITGYYYANGTGNPIIFIARYNANGTLDNTFNSTGKRSFTITNSTAIRVTDLQLQSDGKLLIGGKYFLNGSSLFMIRFNTNGTFDTSFSGDGFQTASVSVNLNRPGKIALQSDGKIIQMDTFVNTTTNNEDMLFVRYLANGEQDTTFNGTSWGVALPFNSLNDVAACVSVVGDKLIITGNAEASVIDNNMAFAKFNLNPLSFDTTFGTTGREQLAVPFPTYEEVKKSVVQSDNKVVVLTKMFVNNLYFSGIQRFNADGSPDASFGSNGKVGLGFYFTDFDALAVDNANNIIVSGYTALSSGVILRITPAGALDPTFGDQGITYLEESLDFIPRINSIKIQSNNKIVLAGGNNVNNIVDYLLIRLNANGTLDNTFGNNGISMVGLDDVSEMITAIEVLNDGKIVGVGFTEENFGNDFQAVILKFNSVGLLDPTFNGNGKFLTNTGVDFYLNGDVKVQNDGKILSTFETLSDNFILYRLNSNGTIDTGFGSGGAVSTYINGFDKSAQIHYNSTNQKITVIGTTLLDDIGQFALVRYTPTGEVDSSFGDNGFVITNTGYSSQVISASPTNDGKLVVSGWQYNDDTQDYDQVMAKYYLEESLSVTNPEYVSVQLYPNPAVETLSVRLKDGATATNYTITDMTGKMVASGEFAANQNVSVAALSTGIYFIKVDDFQPIRFIKQ